MIDCIAHVCAAAEGLLAGGKRPWIGRIRDRRGDFSGPLIPRSMPSVCWTTHYVCCCDGEVHDPLAGDAVPIGEYAERMFGRVLKVEEIVNSEEVAELVARGTLRATLQRLARS